MKSHLLIVLESLKERRPSLSVTLPWPQSTHGNYQYQWRWMKRRGSLSKGDDSVQIIDISV